METIFLHNNHAIPHEWRRPQQKHCGYQFWGNVTSRPYNATTATLTYDVLDHLVAWNAGSTNQQWYAYDASGNRVLLRSTTGSGTSITTYAFGLEEHLYDATDTNTGNTYYYWDTILTPYQLYFPILF